MSWDGAWGQNSGHHDKVEYPKKPENLSCDMTKPTKWHVRPAKTQISLGIRPVWSDVFTVHMKKALVLSYPLSTQRRLWSDWADAQVDLSLRWAHSHFVGFVMSRLICCDYPKSWTVWFYESAMCPKDADGMANSVTPYQTRAVWTGSALFP